MGLTGLDRLFSFMIVKELQLFVNQLMKVVTKDKLWLEVKGIAEANLMPLNRLACESIANQAVFILFILTAGAKYSCNVF